jgi:hypothetical protein
LRVVLVWMQRQSRYISASECLGFGVE